MDCQLLSKEKNKVKIEVVLQKEEFEKYVDQAFKKTRNKFSVQGFRKGKAPKKIIEMQYGEGVFYDEALNILLPVEYDKAVDELEIHPVGRPDVNIVDMGKDVDLKFSAEVDVKPEVILGEYKGAEVKKPNVEATDDEINMELQKNAEMNSRMVIVEGREVQDGDVLTIDYKGSIGDEQFEGGTAENQTLTIGSNQFIPGFEEQLIGANIGDEMKVNVTFPEDYTSEKLAGNEAVFEVKIHEIKVKELPELDDEFAQETSEFETLEELKEDTKKNIEKQNEEKSEEFIRNTAVDFAVDNVEIDIPDSMIDSEVEYMVKDMEQQLSYSGIKLDQYMEMTNSKIEDIKEQMKEDAVKRVKTQLVLEKIIEVESIEVTQEDLDAEVETIAKTQKVSFEEANKIYSRDDYAYLKEMMKSKKVVNFLADNAEVVK